MASHLASPVEDLASPGGSRSGHQLLNSDSLGREAALLLGGSAEGIKAAALKAVHSPEESAIKLGLSVLVGAGLASLAQGSRRWHAACRG